MRVSAYSPIWPGPSACRRTDRPPSCSRSTAGLWRSPVPAGSPCDGWTTPGAGLPPTDTRPRGLRGFLPAVGSLWNAERMLLLSLGSALAAAVCFGLAAVLQAIGMRRAAPGTDPGQLLRALRTWPFLAGLAMDVLGFAFELVALRHLPLFLVQAAIAASLAVTAIAASMFMGERLRRGEWLAIGAVCLGLAALGTSAGPEGATRATNGFYVALVICLVVVGLLGAYAARLPAAARTVTLGACSGLSYGVLALAARTLPHLAPSRLLREPATYLVAVAGLLSLVLWMNALAAGSVTTATAALVVSETLLPAAVGVFVLGDEARTGFVPLAVAGFVLAVGGALALARFGEVDGDVARADSRPAVSVDPMS